MRGFEKNAFFIGKCSSDDRAVADILQEIEVGVCTEKIHFANVVLNVIRIALNLTSFVLGKNLLEEVVAMAHLGEVPRIATTHLVLSWNP